MRSAIVKPPVSGPVAVRGVNLASDEQADTANHGGPDQAVYAYAGEDAAWWGGPDRPRAGAGRVRGEPDDWPGSTSPARGSGSAGASARSELRVAGLRVPCAKLEARIGVPGFMRAFLHGGRPGAYLAIAQAGMLEAGDAVEIVHRPGHDVTVALVIQALIIERERVGELEPARADMLPKLAAWYEERQAA